MENFSYVICINNGRIEPIKEVIGRYPEYNREGYQHCTFTLDKLVTQLKLSEDGQTLYAVAQEPEIHIVQFHLPMQE